MARTASIKETGEQMSDAKWQRFEAAVGADKEHRSNEVQTDQPYREEAPRQENDGGQARPDGHEEGKPESGKTTKRTE